MSKCILIGITILCYIILVFSQSMIGPGKWNIYKTGFKKGDINDIVVDFQQKMLNRTHYVYNGKIIALIPINEELAIKIDVCKFVDGGCKQCQILTDESLKRFIEKFASDNVRTCLELMGIDPPEMPLPAGEYVVENFMVDVEKLPENFTYGHFIADSCIMKMSVPIGCFSCEFEFYEVDDEDDD